MNGDGFGDVGLMMKATTENSARISGVAIRAHLLSLDRPEETTNVWHRVRERLSNAWRRWRSFFGL
jgi:hypothetical protein